jgi:pimeloyl-ACP methyl ester carboxylesterase
VSQIDLQANGLTFRAREHGVGEPVLLLHGFPETSRMWEPLMERLADVGFHCVAPDQRGYSPGACPKGAENYTYKHFAADIGGLMDAMGWERAHLVGHDWGAAAGWTAVGTLPERVMSWTPMSVPHLTAFGTAIRENPEQQGKSQYINFFRQVGTAEDTFSANDYAALRGLFAQTHDKDEVDEYIDVLSQPGALTGALNWYRGSEGIRPDQGDGADWPRCEVPTLLIWGKNDMAIGRAAVENGASYMAGPYELLELDCGHWIVQEALDEVVGPIVGHLKKNS